MIRAYWCAILIFAGTGFAAAADAEPFKLILMPDTQTYCSKFPEIFHAQTQWIVDNPEGIAFVLQQGDITDNNSEGHWKTAQAAMGRLDGKVPYTIALGNHDIGKNGSSNVRDTTNANNFFPLEKYKRRKDFAGAFEEGKIDNIWHVFHAGGIDWLVISLEFGPRNRVIDWAKKIIEDHPKHKVIINTHAYMYSDDTRMNEGDNWLPKEYGLGKAQGDDAVNDGEQIWEKLASQYPNVIFVFCGHVLNDGTGKLISEGKNGNKVYQMLANYQGGVIGTVDGGNGFLRIVTIDVKNKTIDVKTYSPHIKEFKTEPDQQFSFENVDFN